MPTYNIIDEYDIGKEPDCVPVNPYWIVAVISYEYPLTVNREEMLKIKRTDPGSSVSFKNGGKALATVRPIFVIDSDCRTLTISSTKSNHLCQLHAVFANSGINFMSTILPGDWVFAWIVNDKEKFLDLRNRISSLSAANKFDDGLKFVGRVHDMGKTMVQNPDGHRNIQYNLQAVGFKELDSQVFFDPNLMMNIPSLGQFLARFGIDLNKIFEAASTSAGQGAGGITSDLAIPVLLKALIGDGIPPSAANPGDGNVPSAVGLTSSDDAPFAYSLPEEVGKLLGVTVKSKKKGLYSYADIMELIIGLQKYTNTGGSLLSSLAPDNTWATKDGDPGNRHKTVHPLKGTFLPAPLSFHGKSVWTVMGDFLNSAINEMYTCIKLTPRGVVAPTLVVRQLPFSTPMMASALGNEVTSFMELPRWKAHPALVRSMDTGRSDNTHFNFIHVYGQPSASGGLSLTKQIVLNPPFRDEDDIKRYGLTTHMQSVNCSMVDTASDTVGPRKWMLILSDFLMGQQLTLNGTCSMQGVVSPICPGDNFEFDETVFHIEAVNHSCSISGNGAKSFTTQVSLSHGIRSDLPVAKARVPKVNTSTSGAVLDSGVGSADSTDWSDQSMSKAEESGKPLSNSVLVGENSQNPDLYIYTDIVPDDNRTYNPYTAVSNDLPPREKNRKG